MSFMDFVTQLVACGFSRVRNKKKTFFTRCQLMRQCAIYYLLFQQEILKIVNKNVFCKATDVKLISSLFNCVSNHCPSIDMCFNASPMSSMSSSPEARNLSDSNLAMLYCA